MQLNTPTKNKLPILIAIALSAGCLLAEEDIGDTEHALSIDVGITPVDGNYTPPDCACSESVEQQHAPEYNQYNEYSENEYSENPSEEPANPNPAPEPGAGEPDFPSPIPGGEKGKTPYDQGKTFLCGYVALLNAELKFGADLDKLAKAIDACLEEGGHKPVFKKGGITKPPGSEHWNAFLGCKKKGLAAQGIKVEFFESTPYWLPTTQTVNPDAPVGPDNERPTYTSDEVKAAVTKFCEDVKKTLEAGGAVTMDYTVEQMAAEHVVTVDSIECPPEGGMKVTFTDPNDPGTTATMNTNDQGEITTCTPPNSAACSVATGHSDNRVVRALHERPVN